MEELIERLNRAAKSLALVEAQYVERGNKLEQARIAGKIEGIILALSYITEMENAQNGTEN